MKITIEHNDLKCSVEDNSENLTEVMELVKLALLGSGFSQQNIEEYFNNEIK